MHLLISAILFLNIGLTPPAALDGAEPTKPFEGHTVVRFENPTVRDMQAIFALNLMPWSCRVTLATPDYLLTPQERQIVDQMGMKYSVLIPNVQEIVDAEAAAIAAIREAQGGVAGGDPDAWFQVYRTWPEVNAYIDELVALRPDIIEKITVGTTHEDRTIYGMRIASPLEKDDRPVIFLNGCQHAREWIAVMVPMYIADRLVRLHGEDETITNLLAELEFLIVPIVNPDGYEFSYAQPENRLWRKNRRFNGEFQGKASYGVDLNRNWDVDWNGGMSTSENPFSHVYVGPHAFSEPEAQAVRDLILAEPRIVTHLDIHNYTQLVLHPLGFTPEPTPDFEALKELGDLMAETITSVHGYEYLSGHGGDLLYLASGIFADWTYDALGIFGYTLEVRPKTFRPGFELPVEEIVPTCEENFAGVLAMAQFVLDNMVDPVPSCPGDLTGDGGVGVPDLLILLGAWGDCPAPSDECPADLTGNGAVGVADLLSLLANWGEC